MTTGLEIAVIGMAGRFPQASSVDELWSKLVDGRNCVSRLDGDESRVRAFGVLDRVEEFDAAFFGYSPRDAALLDPQQRLFLEFAWEALELAGYAPGSHQHIVGVYGGVGRNDYLQRHAAASGAPADVVHIANGADFAATRVSYKLNLTGPSLAVNTACSTSLVAIHLACQGLIAGECDLALAGGVTVRLPQDEGYTYQEGGILSPDGHCRAFSADARGCVPGNGGAVVVLKRLADALADHDCIHAVIKGSAINNDGSTKVGYTAPAVEGQARVIRAALRAADVSAETIGYLEAHGTGTALGDPIEVEAATEAFRQDTTNRRFCPIGSIKTNVGHLDAGAGVAGFIKAVLAVKNGVVPPSLDCAAPNPRIDFERSPFYVNTELQPWRPTAVPRRAGVSAFGIGGTNAHVIVEEPPTQPPLRRGDAAHLLVLSAKTAPALELTGRRLADHLRTHPDADLADVAFTLRHGRARLPYRRAIVCSHVDEAVRSLTQPTNGAQRNAERNAPAPRLVYMFPGQGAQYAGMGRHLAATHPAFRRCVEDACEIAGPLVDADLRALIVGPASEAGDAQLRDTRLAQPAIFIVSCALARLASSWGLEPAAMIGHSVGEIAAACIANVLSFEDALRLVCDRGRLMATAQPGSMLAVGVDAVELERRLPPALAIAAVNAPGLSVAAGPVDAAQRFAAELERDGIEVHRLHTSHAFHTAAMEGVLDAFTARVAAVRLRPPSIPFVSNVTGTWITAAEATDPTYWSRQLRTTVRFSDGVQTIVDTPGSVFLELGPGHTLTTLVRRHAMRNGTQPAAFAITRRPDGRSDDAATLEALGGLWTAGIEIDWSKIDLAPGRRVPLPTYPFQRERHWLEPSTGDTAIAPVKRPDVGDWFSVPSWERLPDRIGAVSERDASPSARRLYVVFADDHGVGTALADRLRASGDVVCVSAGAHYSASAERFSIDPGIAAHYERLCAALRPRGCETVEVVHCWNVEPDDQVGTGLGRLAENTNRGFFSLLFLGQALDAAAWVQAARITVVTSNLFDVVGSERLCPEKATLLGPVNVIPLESDRIACTLVDVVLPNEPAARAPLVDRVLHAIHDSDRPVVAIRGAHRWAQTLAPVRLDRDDRRLPLRQNGTYLITGGLGGVGLSVAEELARRVDANLVLVGRHVPNGGSDPAAACRTASIDAEAAIRHLAAREPAIAAAVPVRPISETPALERLLDALSTAHVIAFLGRCGIDACSAGTHDIAALQRRCHVVRKFERLFAHMLRILELDGFAVLDGASVRFTGARARPDLGQLRQQADAAHPEAAPIVDLLARAAETFDAVLSERASGIESLFGGQNADVFRRAVEAIRSRSCIPLCEAFARELLTHVAAQRRSGPLKVLEIGGGEGLLTNAILPALSQHPLEYTFTDIGRAFVTGAERRASERGDRFVRARLLDISKSPAAQGFVPHAYDIVVGFNVVHATRRIAETFAHIRELLAPGGLVVLQESVSPARWVDLIWGLTDGWWAFDDLPLRTASPLLDSDQWSSALRQAGFEAVAAFPGQARTADTSVIVARAPLVAAPGFAADTVDNQLAHQERAAALARLESAGATVEFISADVANPIEMDAAIARALGRFGRIDGVIHAALVLNDGAIAGKTREAVEAVFAPKVTGTIVLKEAVAGLDLDFFAIFSSLVSTIGAAGQVDYSAASHFQDAFARAEQGTLARAVVSIDWAAWRQVGKAFRSAVARGAAHDEALPEGMSTAEGIDALLRVLASPYPQILVSPTDPSIVMKRPAGRPDTRSAGTPSGPAAPSTDTERVIAEIWQRVLGVPNLGVRDNFFDLGGDSMISLQFVAEARKAGLRITNRQVFEHQTIAELAAAAAKD